MDTIDTIAFGSSQADTRPPKLRRLGVALLAAALIGATSCGSDTETGTTGTTTTSAAAPTTNTSPTPTTTSPAPTTTTTTATATTTTEPRPTATIDQLVGADGVRVHVRCVGQGETTVLLIAGFGGDASGWVEVEPAIAGRARVCSYERPGTGTSDPATATANFTTQATDLHALLGTIDEPGPYVVVGHSFGGAEAVTFASLFADEVAGLVLIDASPTTWPAALCAVPDDGSEGAAILRAICTGTYPPTGNSEQLEVVAAFAEAAQIVSLGSLPMAVITATRRELPADLATSEVDRLNEAWNQGQQDWMALSPRCTPGVGRPHRPPHRDRSTRCRDRRDHPPAPLAQANPASPPHPRGHHARPSRTRIEPDRVGSVTAESPRRAGRCRFDTPRHRHGSSPSLSRRAAMTSASSLSRDRACSTAASTQASAIVAAGSASRAAMRR